MTIHLRLLAAIFALTTSPLFGQDGVWPTTGWPSGSPEEQGVSTAPLDALSGRIHRGEFGYVNRLVVIRNGVLIQNERYDHDYREISRGRQNDIGCGFGCADDTWDHQFNRSRAMAAIIRLTASVPSSRNASSERSNGT